VRNDGHADRVETTEKEETTMKTTTMITICTLALALPLIAEENTETAERGKGKHGKREHAGRRKPQGSEAFQAFMKEQRDARRTFHEAERKAGKAQHEALLEGAPAAGCKAMIENGTARHAKQVAFATTQNDALQAFIRKDAAENEVPEEQLNKRLAGMAKRYEGMQKHFEEIHTKRMATLTELSTQDELTWDQVREAMKAAHRGEGKRHRRGAEGKGKQRPEKKTPTEIAE
jgi:hypothetical protein